ncbi:MAG: PQQ-binding-like beta-propeller repeat protein [Planctomyces sp.]|nr:PQQ-binding-like beta-propeller repeat protein [Planctomyces sp.]
MDTELGATAPSAASYERGLPWTRRRPRLHRNLNRAFAWMLGLFAAGQIWMWFLSPHPFGLSIPYMVTYGMIIVTTATGLAWLVLCSRWPRPAAWGLALTAVAAIAAIVSSIREIRFNGDMRASIEWRWQPTRQERLAARQWTSAAGSVRDAPEIAAEDMPDYRGANRDGVVVGPPLDDDWKSNPPVIRWRQAIGGGYAQFAVVGDLLVTLEQRGDEEFVVCYAAESGEELWTRSWPGRFWEAMGGEGPRSTPTIADGRVYALGALGRLVCLDLTSGELIWSRDLLEELGLSNSEWAMTSSPLVLGERLIVNIGGHYGGGLIAVRRDDGSDVWKTEGIAAPSDSPPAIVAAALSGEAPPAASDSEHAPPARPDGRRNRAGYASPVLATIDGTPQILNFDGMGLWGHDPDTGRALWFHHFENGPGVNSAQPIVFPDGRILISASYNMGSRMLRVSKPAEQWTVDVLWGGEQKPNRQMKSKMSSPVLVDGHVYGLDEGILVCIDPADGKRLWKGSRTAPSRGRYGHGQMLVTNGRILLMSEDGELALIQPDPRELVELGSLPVFDAGKTWNPPALVRGRAYLRNHEEMACVELCLRRETGEPAATDAGATNAGP